MKRVHSSACRLPTANARKARRAWAVRSQPLRSNGRCPQPRQNVGQPPSRFCRCQQPTQTRCRLSASCDLVRRSLHRLADAMQGQAWPPACRRHPARRPATASRPSRPDRPRCTDAAPCTAAAAASRAARRACPSLSRSPAAARALTRQRRHPGRQVRVDRPAAVGPHRLHQKLDALARPPDDRARPMLARLSVTKLVSGVASRKPPLDGWIASSTRRLLLIASRRTTRASGFHGGR